MKKILSFSVALLLSTTLLQARLTVKDNAFIDAYNKEISQLNQNFAALRTLDDYKNQEKRTKLESNFNNLRKIIKSFSDQKDPQVVSMQKNYKRMVTTYNSNLKTAGVGSSKKASKKSGTSMQTLINEYNKHYNKAVSDYNAMNSESAIKDPKKQQELQDDYKKLTASLEALKKRDAGVYKKAKVGYSSWVSAYKEKSKFFTSASPSTSDTMTAQDRANLKKFRSLYIANDYYFRNVDTVKLQDRAYAEPLEKTLHQLQALLNPMRHKTFDRGVKRADADLKKIEKIFASASSKSKELAKSVSNIDGQLKAIQSVFDQRNFDPRLLVNNVIDEIKTPQEVTQWATRLKAYKEMIPDMKKFLQTARANTIQGRKPEFSRYTYWFENNVESDIDAAILDKERTWKYKISDGIAAYRLRPDDLISLLNSQSEIKILMEKYEVGKKCLENQKALEIVMNNKLSLETTMTKNEYRAFDEKLAQAKKDSIKNQQLPQAVVKDEKLLSLAKSIIKVMARERGEMSHMVIISPLRESRELKYDGTWYMLRWNSFSVSFVEKVGNHYFITKASFTQALENKYSLKMGGKWYLSYMTPSKMGDEILKDKL